MSSTYRLGYKWGDYHAAYIVGDTGWVVPPSDPAALAETIAAAFDSMSDADKSSERSLLARCRIEEHFSIGRMVAAYSECWNEVVMTGEDRA